MPRRWRLSRRQRAYSESPHTHACPRLPAHDARTCVRLPTHARTGCASNHPHTRCTENTQALACAHTLCMCAPWLGHPHHPRVRERARCTHTRAPTQIRTHARTHMHTGRHVPLTRKTADSNQTWRQAQPNSTHLPVEREIAREKESTYTYIHTHIYTYIHTYIYIHTHVHI